MKLKNVFEIINDKLSSSENTDSKNRVEIAYILHKMASEMTTIILVFIFMARVKMKKNGCNLLKQLKVWIF